MEVVYLIIQTLFMTPLFVQAALLDMSFVYATWWKNVKRTRRGVLHEKREIKGFNPISIFAASRHHVQGFGGAKRLH